MSEKTVTINVDEFSQHHDECLDIADQLFTLVLDLAPISLPLSTALHQLANRLDKSISKLPAKFS